ncbi:MAG: aminoglycoside phosphotransferase family protein [Deltaproteobacteria bacterium]|nr:aminoglycoside phosphotransferase family protein [Deltaproteobacteria bacterium]
MIQLGLLSHDDPLHSYLCKEILPQLGMTGETPDFEVYRFLASNHVYLYEVKKSGTRMIGKFFDGISDRSGETAYRHMEREYGNLLHLRNLGFTAYPHYVPRPLGKNPNLNCLLVQEYCYGIPLNDFIMGAIQHGQHEPLFVRLSALACFLATLHNRSARKERVEVGRDCAYFGGIVEQLRQWGHLTGAEADGFHQMKERWRGKGFMGEDNQVLVHGDVTPTNLLFGDPPWVIAIDLERMKAADRVFDVGRIAAELKHFFIQYRNDPGGAEPFIGHFLWEYAGHFPDRESAFQSICRRVPFHMGMTFLRIARNFWITDAHRRRLIVEAQNALR